MLYLIFSVFLYSLNNLLWKKYLKKFDPWHAMFLRAIMTSLIGISILLIFENGIFQRISLQMAYRSSLASLLGGAGLLFMLKSLQYGTLKQMGVFNMLGVFLSALFLVLVEHFPIDKFWLGSTILILGTILYLIQLKQEKSKDSKGVILLYYSLMSIFFTSSTLIHWYNFLGDTPVLFSLVNQEFIVAIIGFSAILYNRKKSKLEFKKTIKEIYQPVFYMAIVIILALWSGFKGLKITNPFFSSIISLSTPILTLAFGAVFLKENWNRKIAFALVAIIIGTFLIVLNLKQSGIQL